MLHVQLNNNLTFVTAQADESLVYYYIDGDGNKLTDNRVLAYPSNHNTVCIRRIEDEEHSVLVTYIHQNQFIVQRIGYDDSDPNNIDISVDTNINTIGKQDMMEFLKYNVSEVSQFGIECGGRHTVHTAVACVVYKDKTTGRVTTVLMTIDVISGKGIAVKQQAYAFDEKIIEEHPIYVSVLAKTNAACVTDGMVAILVSSMTLEASSVINLIPFSRKYRVDSKALFIKVKNGYMNTLIPFEAECRCRDTRLVDFQLSEVFNGTISVLYKIKGNDSWRCRTYLNRSTGITSSNKRVYDSKNCVLGDLMLVGLRNIRYTPSDKLVLLSSGSNIGAITLKEDTTTHDLTLNFRKFKVHTDETSVLEGKTKVSPRVAMESVSTLIVRADSDRNEYSTDIYTDEHGITHISVLRYNTDSPAIASIAKFFITDNADLKCEKQFKIKQELSEPVEEVVEEDIPTDEKKGIELHTIKHVDGSDDTDKPKQPTQPTPTTEPKVPTSKVPKFTEEELRKIDIYARPGDAPKPELQAPIDRRSTEKEMLNPETSVDKDHVQMMIIAAMIYKLHRDCPSCVANKKYTVPLAILPNTSMGMRLWQVVTTDSHKTTLFQTLDEAEGYIYEAVMSIRIDELKLQMDSGSTHAEESLVNLLDHMSSSLAVSYSNWKNRK